MSAVRIRDGSPKKEPSIWMVLFLLSLSVGENALPVAKRSSKQPQTRFAVCEAGARQSKVRLAQFFSSKNFRMLPCFSFFAKSHAKVCYSLASALITHLFRYQLFASFFLCLCFGHRLGRSTRRGSAPYPRWLTIETE